MIVPVMSIAAFFMNYVPPVRYLIEGIAYVVGDMGMFWLFVFCCWSSGILVSYGIFAAVARSNRKLDRTA